MMNAKRPLWLIESPDQSGVSYAARNLVAGMTRDGLSMEIFALRDGESAEDFRLLGCQVKIYPHMGSRFLGRSAFEEARLLQIGIVHAKTPALIKRGLSLAKKLDVPFVVTANRMEDEELKQLVRFPGQGVVAVSEALRERLANSAGIPSSNIRVIPNGLDLTRIDKPNFTHQTFIPGRLPVVGTLGQLAERKGQRVFLQAVKELLNRGLDAEFVILGDGPDRVALRNLAKELNVAKRVTFTPQTVSGQLTQLDVLVEPSLQEGLGLSVMQAMAMGVPVVGTGVGGLYSLIEDGKTGIMVPANNPTALADAIWRILSNPIERVDMARQARELIEAEFNVDLVAERMDQYYKEIISEFHGWRNKNTSFGARG